MKFVSRFHYFHMMRIWKTDWVQPSG